MTAPMAWPRFHSEEQNPAGRKGTQHRLNENTDITGDQSLLESANGSMATVANSAGRKTLSNEKNPELT